MYLWIPKYCFWVDRPEKMWTYPLIVVLFATWVSVTAAQVLRTTKILLPDQNDDFTSMQLFYISFPLEDIAELIPCISSQTVSSQAEKGLRNAGLNTPRQMSGNGWAFSGSNALQISRGHRYRLDFTFDHLEKSLFCSTFWRLAFPVKHFADIFWQLECLCMFKKTVNYESYWRFPIRGEVKVTANRVQAEVVSEVGLFVFRLYSL